MTLRDTQLEIALDGDDVAIELTLHLAASIVSKIETWQCTVLEAIADSHLHIYNESWAEEPLSRDEFLSLIKLKSVSFLGESSVTFFCDDSDLFWGHSIVVEFYGTNDEIIPSPDVKSRVSLFG